MAFTPANQAQYLAPYGQRVFRYGTDSSKVYVSRYTNQLLKSIAKEDNTILFGFETSVTYNGSIVQIFVEPGRAVADWTLLELPEAYTINLSSDQTASLTAGTLVVSIRYQYNPDETYNPFSFSVIHIASDGTYDSNFDVYTPYFDRIVIGAWTVGSGYTFTGIGQVTLSGETFYVRPVAESHDIYERVYINDNIAAPAEQTLPPTVPYIQGKTLLEIYLNGKKLIENIDYEIDQASRLVTFTFELVPGDIIEYIARVA